MTNIIVSMYNKTQNEAGPKAKMDTENFLRSQDFHAQNFTFYGGRRAELTSYKQAFWDIPHKLKGNYKIAIFQYPALNQRTNLAIIKALKKHSEKVYILIHDLESLRYDKKNQEKILSEINLLNQADGIIAHNNQMIKWLKDKGISKQIVNLQIFDYDNPQLLNKDDSLKKSVCYAGNLNKAEFLKNYQPDFKLSLFGPNFRQDLLSENTNYEGSFSPDELPKYLTQSFGLIWDGNSSEYCSGIYGEYLKYNDPHKASLYLSSGLPLIIWKKAALADFVKENNLGIVINSLDEIAPIFEKMTNREYSIIKQNVLSLASKIRTGYFIKKALKELGG